MASIDGWDEAPSPSHKIVELVDDADLIIRVFESEEEMQRCGRTTANKLDLKVKKDIVSTTEFSPALASLLQPRFDQITLEDSEIQLQELKDLNLEAMEIFFREIHGKRFEDLFRVNIETIWHILKNADQYGFKNKPLRPWFATWYSKYTTRHSHPPSVRSIMEYNRALLYPSFVFDEPDAFLAATKSR